MRERGEGLWTLGIVPQTGELMCCVFIYLEVTNRLDSFSVVLLCQSDITHASPLSTTVKYFAALFGHFLSFATYGEERIVTFR